MCNENIENNKDLEICWLCESEAERLKIDGHPELPLLFAATMTVERMMSYLCQPHQKAMEHMCDLSNR